MYSIIIICISYDFVLFLVQSINIQYNTKSSHNCHTREITGNIFKYTAVPSIHNGRHLNRAWEAGYTYVRSCFFLNLLLLLMLLSSSIIIINDINFFTRLLYLLSSLHILFLSLLLNGLLRVLLVMAPTSSYDSKSIPDVTRSLLKTM